MLARDQVSGLQPRLGVQLDPESEKSKQPFEDVPLDATQADNLGHDVLRDNVLERAFREEQQASTSKAAVKAAQPAAKVSPKPTVKEITKELRQTESIRLRSVDDIDARSRHLIREIQSADLPCALAKR